jgi:hypothetical protein
VFAEVPKRTFFILSITPRLAIFLLCLGGCSVVGCSRNATDQSQTVDSRPSGGVEIDWRGRVVSDADIDHWLSHVTLRRLRLGGSDITDDRLARIASLESLELLDLTDCASLTPDSLHSIGRLVGLRNLRLSGESVNDDSVAQLATLRKLSAILLRQTAVTDAGFTKLAVLDNLQEINLMGTGVTDASLATLARFPKLKKLVLRQTAIGGTDASALARMSTVVELDLSETAFGNTGMESVARMSGLRKLNLWLTAVDDVGAGHLISRPELTSLNLDNVRGITDDSLDVIAAMPSLTFLHLGGTSVTAAGLTKLHGLAKLETLIITRLGLTGDQVETVRRAMPSLIRIDWE